MLYPLVRVNRALASILIYPEHPIQSIATSEIISVVGPFLTPTIYKKIMVLTSALLYSPKFANYILSIHFEEYKIYNKREIYCLTIFLLINLLNY